MEEILASIRQTIAAEQDGKVTPADRSAPGNFARTNSAPRPGTPPADRGPPLGRLTEALRQHAPPPSNGLGSKRPASFDDDLADILDEPPGLNGTKVTAPKPSISIAPDVPGFLAPRTTEAKAAAAPQPQTFPAPQPTTASAVDAQPVSQPTTSESAPAPKTTSYPMRRGGFYPPAGYTPTLPSLPPLPEPPPGIEPAHSESAPKHPDGMVKRLTDLGAVAPAPSLTAPAEPAPAAAEEKPVSAAEPAPFMASVSERLGSPEPEPQLGPAPAAQAVGSAPAMKAEPEPKLAPASEGPRPVPLVRGLAESIAAASVPETPAASIVEEPVEVPAPAAEPELLIETVIAEVLAEPAVVQILEEVSVEIVEPEPVETFSPALIETAEPEPEPTEKPVATPSYNGAPYNGAQHNGAQYNGAQYNGAQYNGAQYNGTQHNGAHYNGSAPAPAAPRMSAPSQPAAPPASAAKLALDALAQGLAAAASHPMNQQPSPAPAPHRPDPYAQSTGTLVPVVEPDMRQYPDAAGQRMPVYPPFDPHQSVRTLEDAVADMLKPMLQQWLADNMPRIIEKALRVEAASAVKRGHKPPGT